MRVLVVSDVHSNLVALRAVLADASEVGAVWSLGDVIGYGPEPNACIAELRARDAVSIPGNHDYGVLGRISIEDFNSHARQANLWTRAQLTPESRAYLEALPEVRVVEGVTLAHGSPRHPIWEYLLYPSTAQASFAFFGTPLCLVGHTHVPVIYHQSAAGERVEAQLPGEEPMTLGAGRYIINPGSVGQPRDGDPHAAYLIYDTVTRTAHHRRVAYDIAATQAHMRALGLPAMLSARLELGW
jgi:diadenosine tetraphosphatase ApaH/serine/threonine PP2A family protein phosphatase